MSYKFKKSTLSLLKGFTIIELIVVIAIIAVLAGIVLVSVTQYINKSKEARANADANNIEKALQLFYAKYGDYPYNIASYPCPQLDCQYNIMGGPGNTEPVDSDGHALSEFYGLNWNDYNAKYMSPTAKYMITIADTTNDGVLDCAYVTITSPEEAKIYGCKNIIFNCPSGEGCSYGTFKAAGY